MIKKLDDSLFANIDIIFITEHFNNVTIFCDEMDIFSVDLDKINLDDANFDKDDPETFIHIRLMAWRKRHNQRKPYDKNISKELMSVVLQRTRAGSIWFVDNKTFSV